LPPPEAIVLVLVSTIEYYLAGIKTQSKQSESNLYRLNIRYIPEIENAKCNAKKCGDAPDFLFNGKDYND
jgi:hypothetical protein